ncbi:SDR family NAD(P)-dependent oxidoreductase [Microvirga pudoricolor]|uniref:SDR family NAD(P)-dependent oxidoreductase n=1 Tax=Microvirga pudoricolor TaxID=2778729 RepID=UPI00194F16AD|nr:SDR family oxidoreductase [Microvirga pudoricolor]MBM6593122.1 SDR family oxidoreductase [Microvirga pudoricolor]
MFDISGKVALITGASRGIGKATALQLAKSGAKVVVSSRKQAACDEVVREIRALGGEAIAMACHVGDQTQLKELVLFTEENWGRIDVLVCNAATNPVYGPIGNLSDEAFAKVMTVNVHSTIWLSNLVLPGMAQRGGGSVIMMSSIAALRGTGTIGVYGMSKAAEAALTRNLAVEWGPKGIRVNAIAPGVINTDFARELINDPVRRAQMESRTPLRRFGEPDDIAGIVHFLASDASAYVTGQLIVADGGETIG